MSPETKLLAALGVGVAALTGNLVALVGGAVVGGGVYVAHQYMLRSHIDMLIQSIDAQIRELGNDSGVKELKELKAAYKEDLERSKLGSSLLAVGTVLCPPGGVLYLWWKHTHKTDMLAQHRASILRVLDEIRNEAANSPPD